MKKLELAWMVPAALAIVLGPLWLMYFLGQWVSYELALLGVIGLWLILFSVCMLIKNWRKK